jgi:hypothetical protein
MPTIFGLPQIGYWQAVGIFILCHLLFKGHKDFHHPPPPNGHSAKFRSRVKDFMRKHVGEDRPQEPQEPEPRPAD